MKPATRVFIGFVLCLALAAPSVARALDLTPADLEHLAAGDLVRKSLPNSCRNGFYGGTGFMVVDAPVNAVWAAIQDWEAYPKAFPNTVETTEIARSGDKSLIRMRLGYRILSVKYHVSVVRDEEKKMMSFTLATNRPHDIDNARGYWRLFPQKDGRTLVVYVVAVQVPAGIVTFLGDSIERKLERNLIGLPKYLKRWIESPEGSRYHALTAKN